MFTKVSIYIIYVAMSDAIEDFPMVNQPPAENNSFRGIHHPLAYKVSVNLGNAIFGAHLHGTENIPSEPAVYVPSHRSALDIPPVAIGIYAAKGEPVRFMAKKEMKLWDLPIVGWWMRTGGVLPITQRRDQVNIDELRPFIDAAKDGQNVVIFGEGTRGEGPKIDSLQPGALLVAALAKRSIVPVGVAGTKPFKYRRFHAVFGEAIPADEVYELRRAKAAGTEVLRQQLQVVFDKANSYLK